MYNKNSKERNPILKIPSDKHIYLSFAGLVLIAYFPLWSFLMCLKNDALVLSYPLFHFFSEQLQNGSIPWWHFNIHLGFPLHSDPGFPFWNPIIWIWGLIGSSLYVYTLLVFFYILIGGVGMIRLLKWLGLSYTVQLAGSLTYVLSGFFVAHLEHPHYVFEAAFLPFCLLYFLKIVSTPDIKSSISFAISLFFLVNSGYPSFTISAVYFFTILFILSIFFIPSLRSLSALGNVFLHLITGITAGVLLSLPFLSSVAELYPFFNRGIPLADENALTGGMTLRSLLSIAWPLATAIHPEYTGTDIAWNNIFIGILPFALFLSGLYVTKSKFKFPLFLAGACMLLLSTQGLFKSFFFRSIPLFDHIHSNGGLRIFFILSAIVIAYLTLDDLFVNDKNILIKRICLVLIPLFAIIGIWSFASGSFPAGTPFTATWLKSISVKNAIAIQSIIAVLTLSATYVYYRNRKWLCIVLFADITIAFVINLPYTGLGINHTRFVQHHLDSLEKDLKKISAFQTPAAFPGKDRFFRDPVFFSPVIGYMRESSYPSGLSGYFNFIADSGYNKIANNQPVFCVHKLEYDEDHFELKKIKADSDRMMIEGYMPDHDTLIITQNNYPNWRYHMDDITGKPMSALGSLMAIPVHEGMLNIKLTYWPERVVYCFAVSVIAWIICGLILFKKRSD